MLSQKNIGTTAFVVTFGMFMTEAILHYNLGVHKNSNEEKFIMPPKKDLIKLAIVTGTFSLLNGIVLSEISKK